MNTLTGSESIEKQWETSRQRIARKHDRMHSYESSSATINGLADMLGSVLKQYDSTAAARIRPQSLNTRRHLLQSCILLGNPTIFSSKIQTSA
jgi:hypothetical protein